MKPKRFGSQSGQVVLITLLVLTVATTIALSLIGRSTIDLSISTTLEESARAFSAAEAGIEEALKTGVGTGQAKVLTPGVSYSVSVSSIGGAAGVYQLSRKTFKGSTDTIWLVSHNSDDTVNETPVFTSDQLKICFSREPVTPALVGTVLYKEGTNGTYRVARFALDPDAASRGNNFDSSVVLANGCGLGNFYEKTITFSSLGISVLGVSADTLLSLRLRPVYSDSTLAIDPMGVALPEQGKRFESVGTTETGISRKVTVYEEHRAPMALFDNVIYTQGFFGH